MERKIQKWKELPDDIDSEPRQHLSKHSNHTIAPSTERKSDRCDLSTDHNGHLSPKAEDIQVDDRNENDDEDIEVEMIVPPDGGWGWMIVAACFICNLVIDGIISSFGVFLNGIGVTFGVSNARVALVGSLQAGVDFMVGPFVSALANRYGFRPVAILGSVISCLAFVLSFFSCSIEYMYITYGVLGGIGLGLIGLPAGLTTGFYFERWRALTTGIAVCGSGIGAFVFPPVLDLLVEEYGWRGALLIQAGMLLNCAIFGAMFRPLMPTRIRKVKHNQRQAEVKSPVISKRTSTNSLYSDCPTRNRFFGTNNNTEYPTATQFLRNYANIADESGHTRVPIHEDSVVVIGEDTRSMDEKNKLFSGNLESLNRKIPAIRRHTTSGHCLGLDGGSEKSPTKTSKRNSSSQNPQRPFYRDDAFYGGSLNKLPHYNSKASLDYHTSVTRLPTKDEVEEEECGSHYICSESVRRILTTMLDLSLLKSPSFLLLAISSSITMMGFFTPFLYLPDRAKLSGIDPWTANFLVSVIGIGNAVGRIACGLASSLPGVDALFINNVFTSISGIATICSNISPTKEYQFFYAASYGFSISAYCTLTSVILVDLLGLEKLTNAFGLLYLFQGLATMVGSPLAGVFMDATGSYDATFYISGVLILLSAVICYPLKRINEWEKRKCGKQATDHSQS